MNMFLTICVLASETAETAGYNWGKMIIIALVGGLIIGLIYAMSLRSQLTSVYKNESAADYTKDKSFKVDTSKDSFLYSKVEKEEKTEQQAQPKAEK